MKTISLWTLTGFSLLIAGCGGGGSAPPPPPPPPPPATHSVSGTVTGLAGSGLVLQLNGGGDLTVSANGAFIFGAPLTAGTNYSVTVRTQPSGPAQNCAVTNGTGNAIAANVSNVQVNCATSAFALGGTVTGLSGTGLVVSNAGVDLPLNANGNFAFAAPLTAGSSYAVTVRAQPHGPVQRCSIANGSGVIGAAAVANVAITCTTRYSRFALAVNSSADTVSRYIVDSASGRLRPHGYVTLGGSAQPIAVVLTPDNRFALVLNYGGSGSVSVFSMDAVSGDLVVAQSTVATGFAPFDIKVHPNGRYAYVANAGSGTISAYSVDVNSGALSPLAGSPFPSGSGVRDLAISATGDRLLAVAGDDDRLYAYQVDAGSGSLSLAPGGPALTGDSPIRVVLDATATHAYVTNSSDPSISAFTIASNGALTPISGSPFALTTPGGVRGLAMEPSGRFLYAANYTGFVTVLAIDSAGAPREVFSRATSIGNFLSNPVEVATDTTGRYLYVSAGGGQPNDHIVTLAIDQANGDLTPISGMAEVVTRGGIGALVMTTSDHAAVVKPAGLFVASLGGAISAFTVSANSGELTAAAGSPVSVPNITSPTPGSLATDLFSRTLYVGLAHQPNIATFSIGDGAALMSTGNVSTPLSPLGLVVDPSGRFVFATNENNNTVAQYVASGSTLVPQTSLTVPAGVRPFEIAVDPTGRFAYVASYQTGISGTISQYVIDQHFGRLASSGSSFASGAGAVGVVTDPSGRFAYVTNDGEATISMYSIHPSSGALTPLGKVSAGSRPISAAAEPTGRFLYVPCMDSNAVYGYSINQVNGNLTLLPGSPFATSAAPRNIAVDPSGKFLYTTDYNAAVVTIKAIDPVTGALTPVGNMPVVPQPHDVVLTSVIE